MCFALAMLIFSLSPYFMRLKDMIVNKNSYQNCIFKLVVLFQQGFGEFLYRPTVKLFKKWNREGDFIKFHTSVVQTVLSHLITKLLTRPEVGIKFNKCLFSLCDLSTPFQ